MMLPEDDSVNVETPGALVVALSSLLTWNINVQKKLFVITLNFSDQPRGLAVRVSDY